MFPFSLIVHFLARSTSHSRSFFLCFSLALCTYLLSHSCSRVFVLSLPQFHVLIILFPYYIVLSLSHSYSYSFALIFLCSQLSFSRYLALSHILLLTFSYFPSFVFFILSCTFLLFIFYTCMYICLYLNVLSSSFSYSFKVSFMLS